MNGRSGGVGTFITLFARMLKERGDDVTLVLTRREPYGFTVEPRWREYYRSWGIELIEVHNEPATPSRRPESWLTRLSEQMAPILRDFDVVYFADCANLALQTVRMKRFSTKATPVCVTVLHRPCNWILAADRRYPAIPGDLNLEFVERYSARHSDFVIAPSQHMLDWVRKDGWQFTREPEVLGLPYRLEDVRRPSQAAQYLKRLMFVGRSGGHRSFDLLVSALRELSNESPEELRRLDEVVLMGHEDVPGAANRLRGELKETGLRVTHLENLDSFQACDYLREHVPDALVVVSSPFEDFPLAVIQASLIPGLNLICAREGGAQELFAGNGEAQLFDPLPGALAAKIRERLRAPLAPEELAQYDFVAANERWLAFHDRACGHATRPRPTPVMVAAAPVHRSVDVCVTYYNKARHFPQLLESLEHQTTHDFSVIAVDDGSPDPEARAVFDGMAEKYAPKGWTFFRQPNGYVDAARNQAARRARAEYLLMIDADDAFARNAIERLLEAARLSGDDCLVSGGCLFTGDAFPYDLETGELTAPLFARYMPLGPNVVAGLIDPGVFGGPAILIRRRVFEAIGGYREIRGSAHEDWELHARLALAGYKTDVVPEYLHFYRQVEDGLSRTADNFLAKRRIIETYDRHLASVGMHGAGTAMYALYRQWQDLEKHARNLEIQLGMRKERFQLFGQLHSTPVGWSTLARNAVLATVAGLVVWAGLANSGPSAIAWLSPLTTAQLVGLIAGAIVLGLLTAQGGLLLQLLRQNGRLLLRIEALEERLASRASAALQPGAGLPVGSPAPGFRLVDLYGETVTLDALRTAGKPVLLIFSDPGCGPCTALLPDVARWQCDLTAALTIALISRGSPEANRARSDEHGIAHVLLQENQEVAQSYQAQGMPAAVLVHLDGTIGSPLALGAPAISDLADWAGSAALRPLLSQ